MEVPSPVPGLVISYSYLWVEEAEQGQIEGRKDRPCAVVIAHEEEDGQTVVVVAPITHVEPAAATPAIELPDKTRSRLGLDDQRSWLILSQVNRFHWPGFDLRSVPHDASTCAYGLLPGRMMDEVFLRLRSLYRRLPSIDRNS